MNKKIYIAPHFEQIPFDVKSHLMAFSLTEQNMDQNQMLAPELLDLPNMSDMPE